ncbi:neural cell adhesion molecule 1-like isoform X2 [Carassius carassius]|uniref:neural cell adhesion molecule 1-like isoform X2 n=1 Tax=Carassius carassius TaxID=217509 RepID=UPI0028694F39|nr:neural cell adhesion molecule 1-like isoform X2 [Carassius carassius]
MTASMMMLRLCGLLLIFSSLIDAKLDIISGDPDIQVGIETLLLCKADSEGDFSWLKDDEEIDEDRYVVEKVDESSSKLILKKVELNDVGNYTCVLDNDLGTRKITYQIYVYQTPDFGDTPVYHEFQVNQTVEIPCEVSGQPAVEILWFRNGSIINDDGRGNLRILSDKSLQISGIQQEDSGNYTCVGRIKGRPTERRLQISVVVNEPPTVQIHQDTKRVLAGPDTVSITCVVKGVPRPNISWILPSTSDESRHKYNSDKSELTISAVTRRDFGEYVCKATNKIGEDSATFTLDVSEPDSPILSLSEKKLDKNSFSIPIKQLKDEGSPILNYIVRYKGNKENEEWTEKEIPGNSSEIQLNNLQYDADYQMEVYAVNQNGLSSTAKMNFTIPQPVTQPALGKGGVVGIVMFIFLVLMVSVDAFCCYTKHCGLLNFLAHKIFGYKISVSKGLDEEANNSTGKKPESGDPAAEA